MSSLICCLSYYCLFVVVCSVGLFAENRCIELHSPDGVHSCILRATDSAEALIWFNALHSAMCGSTQRALTDANRALMNVIGELKHIGWLSRRLSGGSTSGGVGGGSSGSGGGGGGSSASAIGGGGAGDLVSGQRKSGELSAASRFKRLIFFICLCNAFTSVLPCYPLSNQSLNITLDFNEITLFTILFRYGTLLFVRMMTL